MSDGIGPLHASGAAAAAVARNALSALLERARRSRVDGLGVQMAALVLVALLPITAFAVFLIVRANWAAHRALEDRMAEQVQTISDAVDREIEQQIRILETLAITSDLGRSDLRGFYKEAKRVLARNENWFGIFVADPNTGQQVLSTLVPLGKALPISSDVESVFATAQTDRPQIISSVTERGAVSRLPVIGVRVPVNRDNTVRWVLSAGLKSSILEEVMRGGKTPPQWTAAVLSADGYIISRNRQPEDFVGRLATADLRAAIARDDFGIFTATTQEGTEVYTVFTRSPLTGWITALGVPAADLDPLTRRPLVVLLGGGLASLLLAVALVVALNRLFAQRRATLARARSAEERAAHVSEIQQALAEKEILLHEVHHRVKNNLQVITSLLRIQARSMPSETRPFVQDSVRRIAAMGRVHDQLYRSERLAEIDLAGYLESLVSDLASSHGAIKRNIRWGIDADRILVDLDTATPLGLILTEAVSNAFKHAFPNETPGEIVVTAKARPDSFAVTVSDNGQGLPPDAASRPGSIGMELIHRLAQQIGAATTVRTDGGTVFEVTVPRRQ